MINLKNHFTKEFKMAFLKICNKNKSKYMIINSSNKYEINQDIIFNRVKKLIKINEKKRNFYYRFFA